MILYQDNKQVKPINEEDLNYMTKQLGQFLEVYTKEVYINDPESFKNLDALTEYLWRLKNKRYDLLIADQSLIKRE